MYYKKVILKNILTISLLIFIKNFNQLLLDLLLILLKLYWARKYKIKKLEKKYKISFQFDLLIIGKF